ncbi:unnamed protein product, partial [Protopolystoma xenopodis]
MPDLEIPNMVYPKYVSTVLPDSDSPSAAVGLPPPTLSSAISTLGPDDLADAAASGLTLPTEVCGPETIGSTSTFAAGLHQLRVGLLTGTDDHEDHLTSLNSLSRPGATACPPKPADIASSSSSSSSSSLCVHHNADFHYSDAVAMAGERQSVPDMHAASIPGRAEFRINNTIVANSMSTPQNPAFSPSNPSSNSTGNWFSQPVAALCSVLDGSGGGAGAGGGVYSSASAGRGSANVNEVPAGLTASLLFQ